MEMQMPDGEADWLGATRRLVHDEVADGVTRTPTSTVIHHVRVAAIRVGFVSTTV